MAKEIAFAKRVKNEIALSEYSKEQKKYILSGFARNGGIFSLGRNPSLTLKSEIACVAKLLYSCLKEVYSLDPVIKYEKIARFGRGLVYVVWVEDKRLYEVMEDLEILKDGFERMQMKTSLHLKNFKYLCIGSFLANGSVNNPSSSKTSYFLEMAFTSKSDAQSVLKKLKTFKEEKTMNFKCIERREKFVLYLKRSDQISVFLSYIGAVEAMFEFENARIQKEDININNRLTICDSANYVKTLETAKRDIDDINLILKTTPITLFDQKVQKVIQTRLQFPDYNYREIAEYISEKSELQITKSGVVHIISSLREKASEIKSRK